MPLQGKVIHTKRLRHFGRESIENGNDATDYTRSYTACSFMPYYAQQLSNAKRDVDGQNERRPAQQGPRKDFVTKMRAMAARGG